jgi:hypothetical protein
VVEILEDVWKEEGWHKLTIMGFTD